MPKNQTITPEVVSADWQSARNLWNAAKTHARASLAAQIMLGWELAHIKKDLGFVGSGRRKKESAQDGHFNLTWDEHLKSELGVSRPTAERFIVMAEAAKKKINSLKPAKTLNLIDTPISDYTDEQRSILTELVEKCTDGQTQTEFLRDINIAKKAQGAAATGGELKSADDNEEEEPTMQDVAFALFTDPVRQLCNLRANGDYLKALAALPVTSTDPTAVTLAILEQQAESLLADVQEARKQSA